MHIQKITGKIQIITGLHIGGANTTIQIGGIDSAVVKNPITNYPTIPGSSIKGKMRSLLEMYVGHNGENPITPKNIEQCAKSDIAQDILRLFGISADGGTHKYGISRLSFYDCDLNSEWAENHKNNNNLSASLTEEKSENVVNRIGGHAEHPRFIERVPAGAVFDFNISVRFLGIDTQDDKDRMLQTLFTGMKLLTMDSLGGSGSRGYGKIQFTDLTSPEISDIQNQLDTIQL